MSLRLAHSVWISLLSEWKQIEDGMVQVRRVLTERYNVEF